MIFYKSLSFSFDPRLFGPKVAVYKAPSDGATALNAALLKFGQSKVVVEDFGGFIAGAIGAVQRGDADSAWLPISFGDASHDGGYRLDAIEPAVSKALQTGEIKMEGVFSAPFEITGYGALSSYPSNPVSACFILGPGPYLFQVNADFLSKQRIDKQVVQTSAVDALTWVLGTRKDAALDQVFVTLQQKHEDAQQALPVAQRTVLDKSRLLVAGDVTILQDSQIRQGVRVIHESEIGRGFHEKLYVLVTAVAVGDRKPLNPDQVREQVNDFVKNRIAVS